MKKIRPFIRDKSITATPLKIIEKKAVSFAVKDNPRREKYELSEILNKII